MSSRSVRHRLAGRPDRPVRVYRKARTGPGQGLPQVTVSLVDFATRVSQSFLILPGHKATAMLTGYIEGPDQMPRVISVPIEVWARVT